MYFPSFKGVLCLSLFCYTLLCVHSSFVILLKRKRKLVALLLLSYRCVVTINVLWLFLMLLWVGLQCVILTFYIYNWKQFNKSSSMKPWDPQLIHLVQINTYWSPTQILVIMPVGSKLVLPQRKLGSSDLKWEKLKISSSQKPWGSHPIYFVCSDV